MPLAFQPWRSNCWRKWSCIRLPAADKAPIPFWAKVPIFIAANCPIFFRKRMPKRYRASSAAIRSKARGPGRHGLGLSRPRHGAGTDGGDQGAAIRGSARSFGRGAVLPRGQGRGAITHANLCTVYDVGEIQGRLFIAMQYLPGATLAETIRREGAFTVPRAVALTIQLARGLAIAHDAGILHRDLKPANIILTAQGDAVVMDFGLAQLHTSQDVHLTRARVCRHAGLRFAGATGRQGEIADTGQRCLQPGGHPLSHARRPTALFRLTGDCDEGSAGRRAAVTGGIAAGDIAGADCHLPPLFTQGAGRAVRHHARLGRCLATAATRAGGYRCASQALDSQGLPIPH